MDKRRNLGGFSANLILAIAVFCVSPAFGQYVLNTQSGKVHVPNCRTIKDSTADHFVPVSSTAGYDICGVCHARSGGTFVPRSTTTNTPAIQQPIRQAIPATQWTPGKTAWNPGTPLPAPVTGRTTPQPTEKPPLEWGWVKVQRVVDGDTLLLENGQSVRLIGADTPETVKPNTPVQPFGPEASEFTKRCIERGENWVFLEEDGDQTDRYGRQLAMVYIKIYHRNDPENKQIRLLNDMLILSGLARARTEFNYSQKMKDKFTRSENNARERNAGIWSNAL